MFVYSASCFYIILQNWLSIIGGSTLSSVLSIACEGENNIEAHLT